MKGKDFKAHNLSNKTRNMGLAKLLKATVILPRIETQEAVSKLAALEYFHPLQNSSEYSHQFMDDLLLKAQKLYQEIDEVIRSLWIPLETGVMSTMFKGAPKEKTNYSIEDIRGFIEDLEKKSATVLEEPKSLISKQNNITKELDEYQTIANALKAAASLNVDVSTFKNLNKFFAEIFIVDSKDVDEIQRSLSDLTIISNKLSDEKSSLSIIGSREDSERIIKVLRSFNVHPVQIPATLPQNPSLAYGQCQTKIKELEAKSKEISKKIEQLRKSSKVPQILSLHETAKLAKDVLETTRKPAGTKNFALIQGYIPNNVEKKFKNLTKNYVTVLEDVGIQKGENETLPTLLSNKKYIKTFEVITETQGLPGIEETDPTPIIAFVWPVFYGLMFADLGHGLLLFGLGMLLRIRGNGSIRTWGTLLAASGAAAAIAGVGTGEMFGVHVTEYPIFGHLFDIFSSIVGILNVSELTFDQVIKILSVSVAIGIIHILLAHCLKLKRDIQRRAKFTILTHDIPTIVQFFAIVGLILAAIGSGYDIIGMFGIGGAEHNEPVPWLTFIFGDWVTVELVAKAAPPIIIATVVVMIYGARKEEEEAAKHGHSEGSGLMGIVIEVILVRIIEVLSNVISYTRLGIMLLVHAALLVTVNQSYISGGGIAVLIGGNIGIMLIEGLIVYIQTIRLHLYEWFPKWYGGEGIEFKKLVPKMLYSNILWID